MKANEYLGHTVFEDGRIFSKKGKQIKHRLNEKGYPQVLLYHNGKDYCKRVHRILAELFIPNPENKKQVNHKDRNRANFNLDNLEWCTAKENAIHSVLNGGRANWTRNNTGVKNGNSKLTESDVLQIRNLYSIGNYSQGKLSIKFGVNQPTINKIVNNKLWANLTTLRLQMKN